MMPNAQKNTEEQWRHIRAIQNVTANSRRPVSATYENRRISEQNITVSVIHVRIAYK